MGKSIRKPGEVNFSSLIDPNAAPAEPAKSGPVNFESLIEAPADTQPEKKKVSDFSSSTALDPLSDQSISSDYVLSPFTAGVPAPAQGQGIVQQIKRKKGFATDEEAIAYGIAANKISTNKQKYAPALKEFNVGNPDEFMNQPVEKIAQWYFDQQQKIADDYRRDITSKAADRVDLGLMGGMLEKNVDETQADRSRDDKTSKLEDIKNNLLTLKLAEYGNPQRIGLEYMRNFQPEEYKLLLKKMAVSPTTAESNLGSYILSNVPANELNKYIPQSLQYDMSQRGYQVLLNKQADDLQEMLPDMSAKRKGHEIKMKDLYGQLQKAIVDKNKPVADKLNHLINATEEAYQEDPVVSNFTTTAADMINNLKAKALNHTNFPAVSETFRRQQLIEQRYNDDGVIGRNLLQDVTLNPNEDTGAYGLVGGLEKGLFGLSKGFAKTLNAALAHTGIIKDEDAFFRNIGIEDQYNLDFYTPSGAQLQAGTGVDIPKNIINLGKELGLDESDLTDFGTPRPTKFNWGGVSTTMGETTGQIIGQAELGGLVGKAAAKAAGLTSKLPGFLGRAGNIAAKALDNPVIRDDRVGLFASTYMQSYGDNYQQAVQAGLSPNKAESYALISSFGSALTELINPDTKVVRNAKGLIPTGATVNELAKVLENQALPRAQRITQFLKDYTKHAFKNVTEETLEEVVDQVKQHALDNVYGIDTTNLPLMEDAIQTAQSMAIGMIPMALAGAYGNSHRVRKEALFEAGRDPQRFQKFFEAKIENEQNQEQKDKLQLQMNSAMKVANTMNQILQELPTVNKVGREMTLEEQQDLAEKLFKARKLASDAKNMTDDVLREPVEAEANKASEEARNILNGLSPAYIVNGKSFDRESFQNYINSPDLAIDAKTKNFDIQVHNDPEIKSELDMKLPKSVIISTENGIKAAETGINMPESGINTAIVTPGLKPDEYLAKKNELEDDIARITNSLAVVEKTSGVSSPAYGAIQKVLASRQADLTALNKKAGVETPAAHENSKTELSINNSPNITNQQQQQNTSSGIPVIQTENQPLVSNLDEKQLQESNKVSPAIKQKFQAAPKVIANLPQTKTLPDGSQITGRYILYPAHSVTASHNPANFQSSNGYPLLENGKNPNDNDYSLAQNKAMVVDFARNYDERALQEIPTITPDGVVIDGNNRTMSGQLAAYQKTDAGYLQSLQQRLPFFGFSQKDYDYVAAKGSPRLGFVTDQIPAYSTHTFSAFNKNQKKEKSPQAKAIELGRTVQQPVLNLIGNELDKHDSMGDFYKSRNGLKHVFDALTENNVLLTSEVPRYYDRNKNAITASGKEFLESLLLGNLVGEDELGLLNKEGILNYRQKIVRAMKPLSEIQALGDDYSLKDILNDAIRLKNELVSSKLSLNDHIKQMDMFSSEPVNPETIIMHFNLEGSDKDFKSFLSRYQDRAKLAYSGAADLFSNEGPASKDKILFDLSNLLENEQQKILSTASAVNDSRQQSASQGRDNPGSTGGDEQSAGVQQTQASNQSAGQEQRNGVQQTAADNSITNNTDNNATVQRPQLQNSDLQTKSNQPQYQPADRGQQNQAEGQTAQPRTDSGNSNVSQSEQKVQEPAKIQKEEITGKEIQDSYPNFFNKLIDLLNQIAVADNRKGPSAEDLQKVTFHSNGVFGLVGRMYDLLPANKTEFENTLAAIRDGESLSSQLLDQREKASKQDAIQAIDKSDFNQDEKNILKTIVDALNKNDYRLEIDMLNKNPLTEFGDLENYFIRGTNALRISDPSTFAHEIGHYGFFEILSPQDRVNFYEQMGSLYDNLQPGQTIQDALKQNTVLAPQEVNGTKLETNTTDSFAEYFAEQFRQHIMSELGEAPAQTLFNKFIDGLIGKVKEFFRNLVAQMTDKGFVDQNLVHYFDKIVNPDKLGPQPVATAETAEGARQKAIDFIRDESQKKEQANRIDDTLRNLKLFNTTRFQPDDKNLNTAHDIIMQMLPLGITSYKDVLDYLTQRNVKSLLPYIEQAYKNIRDNVALSPSLKNSLSNDTEIESVKSGNTTGTSSKTSTGIPGQPKPGVQSGPATSGAGGTEGFVGRPAIRYANEQSVPAPKTEFIVNGQYPMDEHQRLGANLAINHFNDGFNGFMLADGPGVGKTREILAVAQHFLDQGKKPLIIAPNTVLQTTYAKDANQMGIDIKNFEVGTYDDLRTGKIGKGDYSVAIFDESQSLKNIASQRSSLFNSIKSDHQLFVSATPMDKPEHVTYFMGKIFNKSEQEIMDELGLKKEWVRTKSEVTPYVKLTIPFEDYIGRLIDMRNKAIAEGAMLRRELPFYGNVNIRALEMPQELADKIKEIQDIHTERIANAEKIVMGRIANDVVNGNLHLGIKGDFGTVYNTLSSMYNEGKGLAGYIREQIEKLQGNEGLAMLSNIDKITEPYKEDYIFNNTLKDLREGKQVAIIGQAVNEQTVSAGTENSKYGQFDQKVSPLLKSLKTRLEDAGVTVAQLMGGNEKDSYAKAQQEFQSGRARVVLMTSKSGGVGIDLDDQTGKSPRSVYNATIEYAGDMFDQLAGRFSRRNTQTPTEMNLLMYDNNPSDINRFAKAHEKIQTINAAVGSNSLNENKGDLGTPPSETKEQANEPPPGSVPPGNGGAEGENDGQEDDKIKMPFIKDIPFSKRDNLVKMLADYMHRPEQIIKNIEAHGGDINQSNDFYTLYYLANNKSANKISEIDHYLGNTDSPAKDSFIYRLKKDAKDLSRGRGKYFDSARGIPGEISVKNIFNDISLYAYALHAPLRNAYNAELAQRRINNEIVRVVKQIEKMDPAKDAAAINNANQYISELSTGKVQGFELMPDGGSGMTNEQAKDITGDVEKAGLKKMFDDYLQEYRHNVVDPIIDLKYKYGLISDLTYQTLKDYYQGTYVPLKDAGETDGDFFRPMPMDVDRNLYRSKGSTELTYEKRQNPLLQSVVDLKHTIVEGEKNLVYNALGQLIREYPDPSWKVQNFEDRTRDGSSRPAQLEYYQDGERRYIYTSDKELQAALDKDKMKTGVLYKNMAKVMRYFASIQTTLSPQFIVNNALSDYFHANANLSAAHKDALLAKISGYIFSNKKTTPENAPQTNGPALLNRDVLGAARAMWGYEGNKQGGKSEWQDWAQDFALQGGKIAFVDIYHAQDEIDDMTKNFTGDMSAKDKVVSGVRSAISYLERVSTSVENGVRLAVYRAMVEGDSDKGIDGLPKYKAAAIAKMATVDFNRKGTLSPYLNLYFQFFNAGVQGVRSSAQLLKWAGTKGRWLAGGLMASGFGISMLNSLFSDCSGQNKDTDCYWNLQDWEKENFMILPAGSGYFKLRLPRFWGSFYSAGVKLFDAVNGKTTLGGLGKYAINNTWNTLVPFSGPQGLINEDNELMWRQFAPSLMQPAIGFASNEDAFGRPIFKQQLPFQPKKPDSETAFRNTPSFYTGLAEKLNSWSGGSHNVSGAIDVSPNSLEYWFKYGGGGLYTFFEKAGTTTSGLINKAKGGNSGLEPKDVPIISNLYTQPVKYLNLGRVYKMLENSGRTVYSKEEKEEFVGILKEAVRKTPSGDRYMEIDQAEKIRQKFMKAQADLHLRIKREK